MRYENKVAVVAANETMIGVECVKKLLDEGAKVVFYDSDPKHFDLLGNYAARYADSLRTVAIADYLDEAELKRAAEFTLSQFGTVDVAVTALTTATGGGTLETMPESEYQRVMDIVMTGVLLTLKPLAPTMIAKEYGRIVVVSSIEGRTGLKGVNFALAAANAGLGGMVRNMATVLGKHSITANGVAAGVIDGSPMEEATREDALGIIKGRRIGTAEDVAYAVMYLSDDYAAWNTGELLDLNGGRHMT